MIPKLIVKPEGAENFETLCLKLWREIWDCTSIKKNGRNGQNQQGVDIFGIPKNEKTYFGIQCKSKNENKKSSLSKLEIEKEIQAAKLFKPPLKTFLIATTSNRDAKIQEYIRLKNLENLQNGLFNLDIFFWEDIEELIRENPKTYNWFVKQKQVQINFDVEASFMEGGNVLTWIQVINATACC